MFPIIITQESCKKDKYGFGNFLWDVFMVLFTFGFWLIWIFCREMRRNR